MACVPSARQGHRIESDGQAARLGTAVHALLTVPDPWGSARKEAERLDVSYDELRGLLGISLGMRDRLFAAMPANGGHEVRMSATVPGSDVEIAGTADYVAHQGDSGYVADCKTGRSYDPRPHQVRAYAWLLMQEVPSLQRVWAGTWWPRFDVIDGEWLTRQELNSWAQEVAAKAASESETYRPGAEQCRYCPRRFSCDGRREWISAAVQMTLDGTAIESLADDVDGDQLIDAHATMKAVESAVAESLEAIRSRLLDEPSQAVESGKIELRVVEVERRKVADYPGLLHDLVEHFEPEDIWSAAPFGLRDLRSLAMKHAPTGEKGSAADALVERLTELGIIKVSTSLKLERGASTPQMEC